MTGERATKGIDPLAKEVHFDHSKDTFGRVDLQSIFLQKGEEGSSWQ
jgi:hypothetical protein